MKGNLGKGEHVCFSKNKDDWRTPQKLFDDLNTEFHFDCDAAATDLNSKCGEEYLQNALEDPWTKWGHKRFWLNPPYSKNKDFIKKAYDESQNGAIVVCLIPSRTDTTWWHDYIMRAAEIRFFRGRLYFDDAIWPAPFPSCIVVFRKHNRLFPDISMIDARKYRNYNNDHIQRDVVP